MSTPATVTVTKNNWVPKSGVTQTLVNWVVSALFFDEKAQTFDYAMAAATYFKPEFVASGGPFLDQWFGLNNYKDWPANDGIMSTPVAWFTDTSLFDLSNQSAVQVKYNDQPSALWWLLIPFVGFALIKKSAA